MAFISSNAAGTAAWSTACGARATGHMLRRDAGLYPFVRTRGRDAGRGALDVARAVSHLTGRLAFFQVPVITREPADYSSPISSMQQRAPATACALPKRIRVAS